MNSFCYFTQKPFFGEVKFLGSKTVGGQAVVKSWEGGWLKATGKIFAHWRAQSPEKKREREKKTTVGAQNEFTSI